MPLLRLIILWLICAPPALFLTYNLGHGLWTGRLRHSDTRSIALRQRPFAFLALAALFVAMVCYLGYTLAWHTLAFLSEA